MMGVQPALSGPAAYSAIAGVGAEPQDLMKMGLDRARSFLLQAEAAIAAGDRMTKASALNSAATIVEFLLGVSGSEPGSLSECLAKVYHYAMVAILKGNATDDPISVAAGRNALEELAATWRRIFPDALA
ncbi:MAG TPA: flagellar protein FliS [Stellaceae bacterium]|jgi:flagellar biosynthetic protein FliS|nr:flagellar protein FliS [Stellaceae bacterium]